MPAAAMPVHRADGIYPVSGAVTLDGAGLACGTMAVIDENAGDAELVAIQPTLLMLAGGAPYPEPRYLEWNFASHDPARIAAAVAVGRAGRFAMVPGDPEYIFY